VDEIYKKKSDSCRLLASMVEFPCAFLGTVGFQNSEALCHVFLKNTGEVPWPENTKLRLVCGNGAGIKVPSFLCL